ncbi:MAG: TIGR03885 family FMN-dependent LLM class oxidoreductase [Hamadaea sp.]|nr:TIGR03885 family FMN-dependent LLM class oxidoreductase [Hamadaea sp.]
MDTLIGYHASHEQFAPGDLLRHLQHAEQAGFRAGMCSDHLLPWSDRQREGVGFAYAWLGAALQATSLPLGVVSAPGQRYHPVILAQAAATLAAMFPGRFWLAVGTGEYLNEHVTGEQWPSKPGRQARLAECVEVMRALWRGETVDHHGRITVRNARVHTTAEQPPALLAAAVTPATARWAGGWADGLITVNQPLDKLRDVVTAFREGGGADRPVRLQAHLSWARTPQEARDAAFDQWRNAALGYPLAWDLELPEQVDAALVTARPEDLADAVAIGDDPGWHADRIAAYAGLGFDQILLHNVGRNQEEFLDVFGEKVLPRLGGLR